MDILSRRQGLYVAAALAGAMAVLQVPAAAQRADAIHLAANTRAETSARHKAIQQIKSTPPRRKSRCYG